MLAFTIHKQHTMSLKLPSIKIGLTDFVNFILGNQNKSTVVPQIIKRQQQKTFFKHYYMPLQQPLIAYHQQQRNPNILCSIKQLDSSSKQYNKQHAVYQLLINTYLGMEPAQTKIGHWFAPLTGYFYHKNLAVKIKPELGLQYKRKSDKTIKNYLIKLHYKEEELTKPKANLVIALMEQSLTVPNNIPTEYCILDLRRGKRFYRDQRIKNPMLVAGGEADSFLYIWNKILLSP